ncbi:MAG: hypothetical protein IT307_04940 [Chloroflexi bacterium]|nr:hypothetical protein [Chloroflexota bacterium]
MPANTVYFVAALLVTLIGLSYYVYTLDARLRAARRELDRLGQAPETPAPDASANGPSVESERAPSGS